jgi:hypothetical protein
MEENSKYCQKNLKKLIIFTKTLADSGVGVGVGVGEGEGADG